MTTLHEKFTASAGEYLSRLERNNLSPNTLSSYKNVLDRFAAFLSEAEQPDEFAAVAAFAARLHADGVKPSTVRQYMVTLKIFFAAASHRSYAQEIRFGDNPVEPDLMPKVPARPYEQVLTDDQVKLLFRSDPPPHFHHWPRNWAMLMLLLNEKIRNAELLDLRLSDVDMLHHVLTVRSGKGRKWREVDLTDLTEQALMLYLESGQRPAALSDEDYLFGTTAAHEQGAVNTRQGNEKWHRGTTGWLSGVVERTVYAVTGVRDCRSHDLRHVGSRVCLNAGQSMEELQGQLGHSDLKTTQIYCSRLGSKRARDSARAVLTERDKAAAQLKTKNQAAGNIVPLYA